MGAGNLYLKLDTPAVYYAGGHPLENVQLNRDYAEKLIPLLEAQPYIKKCDIYTNQPIDVDLDLFRKSGFDFGKGNIARYYCHVFPVAPNLNNAWLKVKPSPITKDLILINRTERYRNPKLNYEHLVSRKDVVFVGVPFDFPRFGYQMPFMTAKDHLELASWIAGCRAFIGNQSFCFALAEALKKQPRYLEICPYAPNVIPSGKDAYEIWTQELFEKLVSRLEEQP